MERHSSEHGRGTRSVRRITARGVIWEENEGQRQQFSIVTHPETQGELDRWNNMRGLDPPLWGLDRVDQLDDGSVRLIWSGSERVSLIHYCWESRLAPDRMRDLVERMGRVDPIWRAPGEPASSQIFIDHSGQGFFSVLPALHGDGESTASLSAMDEAFLEQLLFGSQVTATQQAGSVEPEVREATRTAGEEPLPVTAPTRRVKNAPGRLGAFALAATLALSALFLWTAWRWESQEGSVRTGAGEQCLTEEELQVTLESILEGRAEALNQGRGHNLGAYLVGDALRGDEEILEGLQRDGATLNDVQFRIEKINNLQCEAGVLSADVLVHQSAYNHCQEVICTTVPAAWNQLSMRLVPAGDKWLLETAQKIL